MARRIKSASQGSDKGGGGGGGGELLQELEALSQALYKAQIVPTATSPRREFNHLGHRRRVSEAAQSTRPKQARALDSRHSISEIVIKEPIEDSAAHDHDLDWNEEEVQEEIDLSQKKKSGGFWNWKPVRALAHIGQQRFHCEFSAHIHGIEKLPPSINGLRLQVHLRHRETGVQTMPARVSHSCVEFEEVLHFRCTVYGSKRSSGGVKYMSKSFTLSVVAVDADELEFGKQQLDLSRILPSNSVPNPQDSNSSWNTSFKLTGKAKGGSLWITFGYEILDGSGSSKQGGGSSGSFGTSPGIRSGGAVSRSFNSLPSSPHTGSMFGKSKIIKSASSAGVMDFGSPAMSEPGNDFGGTMESFNLDEEEKEAPPAARSMRGGVKQQEQQQQQQQLGLPPLPSKHSKAIDVVEHRGKPLFAEIDREIAPGTPGRGQERSEVEDAAADDVAVEFNVVEQGVETSTLDEEILALSEEREAVKNSESQDQEEEEQDREQKDEDDAEEELQVALKDAKQDNEEAEAKVEEPEEVRVEEVAEFDWKRELEEDDQFDNLGSATSASSAALAAEKEYWRQEEELQLMQLKQDSYGLDYGEGGKTELLKADEEDELVTDEFLDMLGGSTAAPVAADDDVARRAAKEYSVDSDDGIENEQDSPRALLLKQFEQEAMEGGFGLDIDEAEAQLSFGSPIVPDFRLDEDVVDADDETFQQRPQQQQKSEEDWSSDEDKELAAIMDAAESELQKATQAMKSKARAKMLEDAEAEALLNKWGLDEQVFKDDESSAAAAAAAAAAVEEQALSSSSDIVVRQGLPSLAPGLGTSVPTADGGSLRSMDPSHFQNGKKNDGKLVMHVSKPVVVPAEMGSTALDVLRNFAAAGTETMATEALAAMPLQDITGKSVEQIALEGEVCFEENNRRYDAALLGYGENRLALEGREADGDRLALSTSSASSLYQSKPRKQRKAQQSEFLQLDELAPVAMEKIEELAMQGLKIQCDMADEDVPYTLDPAHNRSLLKGSSSSSSNNLSLLEGDASDGMISMSLSLDEWMRLDAGIADEEEVSEKTKAIMAAHKAAHTTTDLVLNLSGDHKGQSSSSSDDGSGAGKMGNTLTLAMLVQLRDPLRNYEPVGAPMMALVEAERVMIPPRPKLWKRVGLKGNSEAEFNEDDEGDEGGVQPQFRITGVHMAGLNADEDLKDSSKKRQQQQLWGNQRQQQSGSRWLVANGMGKTGGAKHPLLKSSKNKSSAGEASLWSVSSRPLDSSAAAKSSVTRNPDVKFGKTSAFGGFRKR